MKKDVSLPKITIVTPSYNQARYLEATIQSIVAQDYPNLEWFIVDGGSKDDSAKIIRKYEKHLTWWVSEKDRGQTDALNKGYKRATGEIFCFVNSDDTLEPGCLHYVAKQFTPGVDWVVGWAKYFDDNGDEWYYGPKGVRRPIDWLVSNPIPQIASFWRTSLREKVGLFSETLHWSFDYEYWLRFFLKSNIHPKLVRRCMGGFRLQAGSKTITQPEIFDKENAMLRKEYRTLLPTADRPKLGRELEKKRSRLERDQIWRALQAGDRKTARKLALSQLSNGPTYPESWKIAYFALRGY